MPPVFAAIPGILAAIGGGSAAAGAATAGSLALGGTELVKSLTAGGAPAASPFPTTTQTAATKNNLAQIVSAGSGNVQQATGGGTSPGYLAELLGSQSGSLSNLNQLQDLLSASPSLTSGGTPANPADLSIPPQSNASLSGGSGLADYGNIFGGG
jgi:hypothetical protein